MPDSTATTLATAGARAVAGPTSDLTLHGKKGNETPAADSAQVPAEPRPQQPANPGEIPAQEAPQSEVAATPVSPGHAEPRDVEVELKLLVDADRFADFNDAPVISANARNKGVRKHLKSVYYDTPERTLWRNGLTLRVRQNGARFVQTVKAEFRDDPLRRGDRDRPALQPAALHRDLPDGSQQRADDGDPEQGRLRHEPRGAAEPPHGHRDDERVDVRVVVRREDERSAGRQLLRVQDADAGDRPHERDDERGEHPPERGARPLAPVSHRP